MTDTDATDTNTAAPEPAAPAEGTFSSLRIPTYRRLWLAGLFTFAAVAMQTTVRSFLAFDLTQRNSALGLVLLAMGVPMLIFTPVGGIAADRFPKRLVLVTSISMMWLPAAFVAGALLADRLEFWMLVGSSVLQGAAFSLMAPTRMAFSAELVGRERLTNAILLAQISMNGTRVLGPSIAGAVIGIETLGATAVYLAVAALLLVSIALAVSLPPGLPRATGSTRSPLGDLVDGLRYVRSTPPVLWPVLMGITVVATAFPYVAFLASLVDDVFDRSAEWLGFLSTTGAIGAVVSSLVIARRGTKDLGDHTVAVVAIAFGAFVVLLGVTPTIEAALLVVLLTGAANAAFQALNNSLVLLRAEEQYHGRVQSLQMLGFSAFGIFAAPLGAVADVIGLRTTLIVMGCFSMAAVIVLHLVILRTVPREHPGT